MYESEYELIYDEFEKARKKDLLEMTKYYTGGMTLKQVEAFKAALQTNKTLAKRLWDEYNEEL